MSDLSDDEKAYLEKETREHIAWMREHVRCRTCKHKRIWEQGFMGDVQEVTAVCGNPDAPAYLSPANGDESCASHWEPK